MLVSYNTDRQVEDKGTYSIFTQLGAFFHRLRKMSLYVGSEVKGSSKSAVTKSCEDAHLSKPATMQRKDHLDEWMDSTTTELLTSNGGLQRHLL